MQNRISGVYQILCTLNKKIYIGSSLNISKRWSYHLQDLKNNRHKNIHLQRAWNLYGEKCFEFSIVEIVDEPHRLIVKEQFWMDSTKSYEHDKGFNICAIAQSQLGRKWTDEQKKRQSERMKGVPLSQERRNRLKETLKGENIPTSKLTAKDVVEIVRLNNNGFSNQEIADRYGVKRNTICAVLNRQNWTHVTDNLEIFKIIKSGVAGEAHPRSKLSEQDVFDILSELKKKVKIVDLARKYQVNVGTISRIKNGNGWKNIENKKQQTCFGDSRG